MPVAAAGDLEAKKKERKRKEREKGTGSGTKTAHLLLKFGLLGKRRVSEE